MASGRAVRLPVLFAILLSTVVGITGALVTGPAFGQGAIFEVITKLIQQQQELAERRRQETAAIRRMQFGLRELGYYDGPIDGDFGPRTAAALGAYRRSMGRSNSGLLSIEEIAEIEGRASEQIASQPAVDHTGSAVFGSIYFGQFHSRRYASEARCEASGRRCLDHNSQ